MVTGLVAFTRRLQHDLIRRVFPKHQLFDDSEESLPLDISERFGGRFGYSIDFRSEVALSEPVSGAVVARSVRTMTQYSAADARDGGQQ